MGIPKKEGHPEYIMYVFSKELVWLTISAEVFFFILKT
jgi:hypothetical protein